MHIVASNVFHDAMLAHPKFPIYLIGCNVAVLLLPAPTGTTANKQHITAWLKQIVSREGLNLLMVLNQELACLEFLGVHGIQQLPPGDVGWLQILPVELLRSVNVCQPGVLMFHHCIHGEVS